jgi:hypothetical protein
MDHRREGSRFDLLVMNGHDLSIDLPQKNAGSPGARRYQRGMRARWDASLLLLGLLRHAHSRENREKQRILHAKTRLNARKNAQKALSAGNSEQPVRSARSILGGQNACRGSSRGQPLFKSQPPRPTLARIRNLRSGHLGPRKNPLHEHLRAKPTRCGRGSTGEIRRACPVRLKGNERGAESGPGCARLRGDSRSGQISGGSLAGRGRLVIFRVRHARSAAAAFPQSP